MNLHEVAYWLQIVSDFESNTFSLQHPCSFHHTTQLICMLPCLWAYYKDFSPSDCLLVFKTIIIQSISSFLGPSLYLDSMKCRILELEGIFEAIKFNTSFTVEKWTVPEKLSDMKKVIKLVSCRVAPELQNHLN